jgi:hypothetical protein
VFEQYDLKLNCVLRFLSIWQRPVPVGFCCICSVTADRSPPGDPRPATRLETRAYSPHTGDNDSSRRTPSRSTTSESDKVELRRKILQRAGRLTRPQGILTLTLSANRAVQDEIVNYFEALQAA